MIQIKMNEEEKNAIEIIKGLAIYYDDYSLLDEEEIEENESVNKSIELILNLIEKLQKENEELKKDYYNVINKIENKLKIRKEELGESKDSIEARLILREIYVLEELLESEK